MRKISFVQLCLSVLILFSTFACEKNDVIPSKETTTRSDYVVVDGVLTFSSDEACQRTVEMVNKMTEEERLTWEKSINFRSLGTIADQFYYSIDFDKFSSLEELIGFFHNNGDKLVVENKNGEYSFGPSRMGNVNRHIINQDGIYAIGNMAYKELNNRIVSAPISKIDELKVISDTRNNDSPSFIGVVREVTASETMYAHAKEKPKDKYYKYRMTVTIKSFIKYDSPYEIEGVSTGQNFYTKRTYHVGVAINNDVRGIFGAWFSQQSTTSYYGNATGYCTGEPRYTHVFQENNRLDDNIYNYLDKNLSESSTNTQDLGAPYLVSFTIHAENWKGCALDVTWVNPDL